jgi:hypothetical protein
MYEMCFMGEVVGFGVVLVDGFEVRAGVNGGRSIWEVIDS